MRKKHIFSGDWDGMEYDIKISVGQKMPIIHSGGENEYLVQLWAELCPPKFICLSPNSSILECTRITIFEDRVLKK